MSMSDARLAASLAEQAGALVLELRDRSGFTGRDLGRRSDTDSNVLLLQRLAAERPGDAVLSEESVDSPARLSADRVRIIDPLDSTQKIRHAAAHRLGSPVALWERGKGRSTAAAVAVSADAETPGCVKPMPRTFISTFGALADTGVPGTAIHTSQGSR